MNQPSVPGAEGLTLLNFAGLKKIIIVHVGTVVAAICIAAK